jgi:hypothetical protein
MQTIPRPLDPPFEVNQDLTTYDPNKHLPASTSGFELRERCIEAFFYHFHPAHPFLLPRTEFMELRQKQNVDHVLAAMRYVGSAYVSSANTVALGLEAERIVYAVDCPQDAYRVQAMLILTLGLDGYTYQEKALQNLLDAQDLALQLQMNKREFAFLNSNGSQIAEESWRRTWWELYLVDGMIAGVHQKSDFRMKDIPHDVQLPCEEKEYLSGVRSKLNTPEQSWPFQFIPQPSSIGEFDDDSFDGKDLTFSSFTYRIAAIRNLGRVLSSGVLQSSSPDGDAVLRVDAHLVNWRLHLPENKKKFINKEGKLDEMIFQAHMITEA